MVIKGTVPSCTEEIAQLPIIPIPKLVTASLKGDLSDMWRPTEWLHLAKAWFTDSSSTTDGTKSNGNYQSIGQGKELSILRKEQ